VEDETPRRLDPLLSREEAAQILLDDLRVAGPGEAEPAGHARHVPIDGHRRDAEGVPEDDRCRLATDAPEPDEPVHVAGDLPAELAEDLLTASADRLRLLPEEAGLVDVFLELGNRDGEVVLGSAVFREEAARDLVHPFVLRLGGEDGRDEELERASELEGGSPVGVRLGKLRQDLPSARASRRRILTWHGPKGSAPRRVDPR
jgi:hypothetical protein